MFSFGIQEENINPVGNYLPASSLNPFGVVLPHSAPSFLFGNIVPRAPKKVRVRGRPCLYCGGEHWDNQCRLLKIGSKRKRRNF